VTSTTPAAAASGPFSPEQKEYLQGFMAGVAASGQLAFVGQTSAGQFTATPGAAAGANLAAPARINEPAVFGTLVSDLCKEERWKYEENPLDAWERLTRHAAEDKTPDPENTYRFKTHGLFLVAPAQEGFMLRLRIPACELTAHQLHGLADLAATHGGGYADITTRGNLQIREFRARDLITVVTRIQDLGLTSRGSGADNIRNVTATPTSGFDRDELIDVRPFAKGLHHYILNHRDLYGLPRKFNVAFDSGGSLSAATDTNDIAFVAVRVPAFSEGAVPEPITPGIYFRVQLGGITGHGDFARDTGLLIKPAESVAVAAAMIRVFGEHADRTNRKKARLKYLLEKWGVERFLAETEKRLAFPLVRRPLDGCEPRGALIKHGWLGVYKQAQRGLNYVGVGIPVGRMTAKQMHALAEISTHYASGELRLTVWQNLIIPHVPDSLVDSVKRQLHHHGFHTEASSTTGGIIACTGSRGCKYAAADTKAHALALGRHLDAKGPRLERPINLHFTGCAHSCAQHYCGDIGFMGAKTTDGAEAFHIVLGGGMDHEQGIARELLRGVRAEEIPATVTRILHVYEAGKMRGESFVEWSRRHSLKELQELYSP
jgi:ferredoxin-nitrite reductase